MTEKRTVGVAGLGHVGAHVAFCLGMMGVADEILLCDVNEQKAVSECQDLNDAVMYMPNHSFYRVVDYRGLKNADIIVNAVGDVSLLCYRQPGRRTGKQCTPGSRLCSQSDGSRIPGNFCNHYESL